MVSVVDIDSNGSLRHYYRSDWHYKWRGMGWQAGALLSSGSFCPRGSKLKLKLKLTKSMIQN